MAYIQIALYRRMRGERAREQPRVRIDVTDKYDVEGMVVSSLLPRLPAHWRAFIEGGFFKSQLVRQIRSLVALRILVRGEITRRD